MIAPLWIAGLWGFAEATFFFLVPDVWLSFLAIESFTQGVAGSFAALAGALNGGSLMWFYGRRSPLEAFNFLSRMGSFANAKGWTTPCPKASRAAS